MKLLRYGNPGSEKPGCLDSTGQLRDLSAHLDDLTGHALLPDSLKKLAALDPLSLPLVDGRERIGPCVGHCGKFVCIGLNYHDHAIEMGYPVPHEPIVFAKATSAICGPNDPTIIPRGSSQTDWEVELGVVIGKPAKHVTPARALEHVAGYCVINDVSERDFQLNGQGQWMKGKSCDTFGPVGPWLVTTDEITDPQNLALWLEVDGKRFQHGHTRNMIFSVATLISYLSRFFTLHPGDILSTGTPAGVGLGQKPAPIFLRAGQQVTLGVEGLGTQRHTMVDEI